MSLQINTFLSVSDDGTIAGWHCEDGTCRFLYEKLVERGTIKIVLCENDHCCAWFWIKGASASLVNLTEGKILQKIDFIGLISFSLFMKRIDFGIDAVMIGTYENRYYKESNNGTLCLIESESNDLNLAENIVACLYGIVKYKNNSFSIYFPKSQTPAFSDTLNDIPPGDMISVVMWISFDVLLIGTFSGFFRRYKMKVESVEKSQKLKLDKKIKFSIQNCCIFSSVAYIKDIGVIFSTLSDKNDHDFGHVLCLSEDNKVVKLNMPHNDKLCCNPDPQSRTIIQHDYGSTFEIFDWSNLQSEKKIYNLLSSNFPVSQSADFKKEGNIGMQFYSNEDIKITAISCHYSSHPNKKLQIIVGGSDGRLYFFWEHLPRPTGIINSLVAPIIGIGYLPIKFSGKSCFVAIGDNGSFCLFKWTKLSMIYESNSLPIASIGFIMSQQLIVVQKIDNSYYCYELNDPTPVSITLYKPSGCQTIWSRVRFSKPSGIISTLSLDIQGSSIFYSVLEVSKLEFNSEEQEEQLNENTENSLLIPIDPHKKDQNKSSNLKNIIKGILDIMSPTINRTKSIHELTNIKKYSNSNMSTDFSFVLMGYHNFPTFFYPMFKLTGPTIIETSPYNVCFHYISYTLMERYLGYDATILGHEIHSKIFSFVSIITQFLYFNNENVQKIAVLTCIKSIEWVTEQTCQELTKTYIEYLNKKNLADYDKFLLGIIMVHFSEYVPRKFHKIVFEFLTSFSNQNYLFTPNSQNNESGESVASNSISKVKPFSGLSSLAYIILLSNFELWSELSSQKVIMRQYLRFIYYKCNIENSKQLFYSIVSNNFEVFSNTIQIVLEESPFQAIATWICELLTEISINNPKKIGTLGALSIARLGNHYVQFSEIFMNELEKHLKYFSGKILYEDQILIISTDDGFIFAFKNLKFLFQEKLFDSPITQISLGPKSKFAAAISNNELKIFDLKESGIFFSNKKRVISSQQLVQKTEKYEITWIEKNECQAK